MKSFATAIAVLLFVGELGAQPATPIDALDVIESSRGGRHWIDQETALPKSPEVSLQCMEIEPGLRIELVAAEPLVFDPVAIAFDHLGRMFVAEYGDYPTGPVGGGDALSRVVLLQDSDGDGKLDQRRVFADNLTFAHSLMPYNGGLLVAVQTQLLFLKDTDGDEEADVRKVVLEGFVPAHPQMQVGNPRWGLDNWIYLNYGAGTITSPGRPGQSTKLSRTDFRFHPQSLQIEPDGGLGQFGNTVDRWGNRFYCSNRNPIMATMLPYRAMQRNPFASVAASHYDVGKSGGDTRVYPLVEMKSNYLSHAGTHTAACGVTANLSDKLGPEYRNSLFVCEPIGHLVTHSIVQPHGALLRARRAREDAEFIASSDTWFRPSSLANGPDGAIYLADMYRLWVEHPNFLPPEIAKQIDWRAGDDRGRIYRIVAEGATRDSYEPPASNEDILRMLESPNAWCQFVAQRLLVERQVNDAAPQLRVMLEQNPQATTRLHAMWTLEGIGELQSSDVTMAMGDSDPLVRQNAARLSANFQEDEVVLTELGSLAADVDARVQFQTLLSLGDFHDDRTISWIADITCRHADETWFARALLTTAKGRAGALLCSLVKNQGFVLSGSPVRIDTIRRLAEIVGARGNVGELKMVLRIVAEQGGRKWWRAAALSGLGKGIPKRRDSLGRKSLAHFLRDPPAEISDVAFKARAILDAYQVVAIDNSVPIVDRLAAVDLLKMRPLSETRETFVKLLSASQPGELQRAALDSVSAFGSDGAAELVLSRWSELAPAVRTPALTMLLRRRDATRLMLKAIESETMSPAQLSIDQRVSLLKHPDNEIRSLATKLLGGAISTNRRAVTSQYASAANQKGNAALGKIVFQRVCANCHKLNGQGHDTGPDLSDVRNRSKLSLLYDILDPNAKVEPQFTAYTVVTREGLTLNGLIANENSESIVLKMAEGKTQSIARSEIDELHMSRVSLMPEGVEKDVTLQQMTDLLEFLKQ